MPGPRVPKTFGLGRVTLDLDEKPFKVGHASRDVPRANVQDAPSQQLDERSQRSLSYADFGPLFDNDMDMSGMEEDIDKDDDEDNDEGAIDQENTLLRTKLADLIVDSIDYDEVLPTGFNEDQLRLDLEYAERDIDDEGPNTIPFDEDFTDEDLVN